jgi:hypothetical protein
MDDVTRTVTPGTPVWVPERRNGKVEIGVNFLNENGQRMAFDAVEPRRYLELWDAGLLKHQHEGKPKPEHLPDRQAVVKFLEQEKTKKPEPSPWLPGVKTAITSSIPVTPRQQKQEEPEEDVARADAAKARLEMLKEVGRKRAQIPMKPEKPAAQESEPEATTVVVPKDSFLAEHLGLTKKFDSKEVPERKKRNISLAPGLNLDMSAKKVPGLTQRERDILEDIFAGKKPSGLTPVSTSARMSGIATALGIPVTNRYEGFDRRNALSLVWNRYKELVARGELPVIPKPTPPKQRPTAGEERELRDLFRELTPAQREDVLKKLRALAGE